MGDHALLTRLCIGQQRVQMLLGACLLLLVSMPLVVTGGSNTTDAAVLQRFAAQYKVAVWLSSNSSSTPCSGWQGVTCDSTSRVTGLQLSSAGIAGTFPDYLDQLDSLAVLQLATGQLQGTLPDSWPQSFPLLRQLDLSANNISGGMPTTWMATGAFPNLTSLNLQGAFSKNTTRTLPFAQDTAGMAKLTSLNLALCNITGPLTSTWGRGFTNLSTLVLSNNMLTGQLPNTWGASPSTSQLQQLMLDGNQITGQIPPDWGANGSFTQLQWLSLASNRLTGSMPSAWGAADSLPALQTLQLNGNNLTGTLPASWGQSTGLSQLSSVFLQGNMLTGGIPLSWANNRSSMAKFLRPGNPGMCEPVQARLTGVKTFGTVLAQQAVSCLTAGCNQEGDVTAALAVDTTEGCVVTVNADRSIDTSAGCSPGVPQNFCLSTAHMLQRSGLRQVSCFQLGLLPYKRLQ